MATIHGYTLVELSEEHAVNSELQTPPLKRSFGTDPDIEKRNVEIRIGSRPTALDLKRLFEASGRTIPPELQLFTSYRIWLFTYHVGIVQTPGVDSVKRFSFEVKFNDKPKVTVISLFPETRFITTGGVDASAKLVAGVDLKGGAVLPTVDMILPGTTPLRVDAEGDAKLELSGQVNVIGQLSFRVVTPVVAAVGVGDFYSQWAFERDVQPLVGDQMMAHTVLVPKSVQRLEAQARVAATLSAFDLLPDRRVSDWMPLSFELPREDTP